MDFTLRMPVRVWQSVDACADNSVAVDTVEGVAESTRIGGSVREEGWRAAAAYAGELDEIGWPPADYLLPITLERSHWAWILTQLERWEPEELDVFAVQARELIVRAFADA